MPSLGPLQSDKEMSRLADRYTSLSTALVGFYASQEGAPLDSFVADHALDLPAVFGRPGVSLDPSKASTLQGLNSQMVASGLGVDPRSSGGLNGYLGALESSSGTVEAKVAQQGAAWASQLASVRTPALSAPSLPSRDTAAAAGAIYERSLTAMLTDFPDLYAQVSTTGLGSDAAGQAWRTSMVNAMASVRGVSATSGFANPCYGDLMEAVASGVNAPSNGCGSCGAAGVYVHSQMSRLFDGTSPSEWHSPLGAALPPSDIGSLPGWQRQLVSDGAQSTEALPGQLDSALGKGSACSGAPEGATSSALQASLPGVFSSLGG